MNSKISLYPLIIIIIICISVNFIIIIPLNKKLEELNLQKDEIIMENENKKVSSVINSNYSDEMKNISTYNNREIIEINNKIEKITDVEYIEKSISGNENEAEDIILNIKVKGSEKDMFTVIEAVEKMNIKSIIRGIEIEKNYTEETINTEKNNNKWNKKNSKNKGKDNNKKPNSYTCILKLEIV